MCSIPVTCEAGGGPHESRLLRAGPPVGRISGTCARLRSMRMLHQMRDVAKWLTLLFIAVVAVSPIFEVFDKTDGITQDVSDLARYALCLFCFLAFALRRSAIGLRLISFRKWITGPMRRPPVEGYLSGALPRSTTDRALFITLHHLRI